MRVFCACTANTQCLPLAICVDMCASGDAACQQACATGDPDGISDALLMSNCGATACPTQCPGLTPLSPCEACLATSCSSDFNACGADAACQTYVTCLQTCSSTDLTCLAQCTTAAPSGTLKLAAPVILCTKTTCSSSCG